MKKWLTIVALGATIATGLSTRLAGCTAPAGRGVCVGLAVTGSIGELLNALASVDQSAHN